MFFFGTQCRMIVLPYGETIDTGALRTDRQTNRQTDGWTDRIAISISRVRKYKQMNNINNTFLFQLIFLVYSKMSSRMS